MHYAGEVEDTVIGRLAVPVIVAFSCGLMTLC